MRPVLIRWAIALMMAAGAGYGVHLGVQQLGMDAESALGEFIGAGMLSVIAFVVAAGGMRRKTDRSLGLTDARPHA